MHPSLILTIFFCKPNFVYEILKENFLQLGCIRSIFFNLSDLSKTLINTAFFSCSLQVLRVSKSKSNIFRPSVFPYFHTWLYIPKIAVETEKMNQCTSQLDPKLKNRQKTAWSHDPALASHVIKDNARAAPSVEFTAQRQIWRSIIYPETFLISLWYFACVFYSPILSFTYNFGSADVFLRFLWYFFKFPYIMI